MEQKKKKRKAFWITLLCLLGLGIIIGGSVGGVYANRHQTTPTTSVKDIKPSILSANDDIWYYRKPSSLGDLNSSALLNTLPANFTQTIQLNNPYGYKIEASFAFYLGKKEIPSYSYSDIINNKLQYTTSDNNCTFTFSVPVNSDSPHLSGFLVVAATKNMSLVITLNFVNNENQVISGYALTQTYTFKNVILSPNINNTLATSGNGSNTMSLNYDLVTNTLPSNSINLELSSFATNFHNSFPPTSANLEKINTSLEGCGWEISATSGANWSNLSSASTLTQSTIETWIKDNLANLKDSNNNSVTLTIFGYYTYLINDKTYHFPSQTQWTINITFTN